jgi:hypothetical protein
MTQIAPLTDEQRAERLFVMHAMRAGGETYAAIGAEFGLSGERVRQVLTKCNGGTPMSLGTRAYRTGKVCPAAVKRLLESGCTIKDAAEKLGIHENTGKSLVRALGIRNLRRADAGRVSTEELAHRLNELAECLGRAPTLRDMHAAGFDHMAYYARFGSLSAARAAAGLSHLPAPRRGRKPRVAQAA